MRKAINEFIRDSSEREFNMLLHYAGEEHEFVSSQFMGMFKFHKNFDPDNQRERLIKLRNGIE